MSVDVQESGGFHTWVLVRAYNDEGKSRMVWAGRLETWGDIEAKAEEFKVLPKMVFIDSGDQTRDVYYQCCLHGWIALVGSDRSSFSEIVNEKKVTRPFAESLMATPYRVRQGNLGLGGSGGYVQFGGGLTHPSKTYSPTSSTPKDLWPMMPPKFGTTILEQR